jgi:hypothetical protein
MSSEISTFEDPELKAAVRRAWGSEVAPADLRRRVRQVLLSVTTPVAADVIRVPASTWRRAIAWSAAAAVLLAIAVFAIVSRPGTSGTQQVAQVTPPGSLPSDLSAQLVHCHDKCSHLAPHDHHFFTAAPKDDFNAIAKGMTADLHYQVVAKPIGSEWDFRGAAECTVGSTKSAHLLYARGDAFVSVFSLPASRHPACKAHYTCDATIQSHPMAGFSEDGAFYCVVASTAGATQVDLQQIKSIRDRLQADVKAEIAASRGSLLAAAR